MVDSPVVSVVMPVRDGACFLRQAVESILDQTLSDLELIVVDDGSIDTTPAIVSEYARHDRRIRPFFTSGAGIVQAASLACEQARGRYLARMDADDVAARRRLEKQIGLLEQRRDVVLLAGRANFIDAAGRLVPGEDPLWHETSSRVRNLLQGNSLIHSSTVVRRSSFENVGGLRPALAFAEDYDLYLRLAEVGVIERLSEIVVSYRIHANQTSVHRLADQVTAAVAARMAAEARAGTGVDPFDANPTTAAGDLAKSAGPRSVARLLEESRAGIVDRLQRAGEQEAARLVASGEQSRVEPPEIRLEAGAREHRERST